MISFEYIFLSAIFTLPIAIPCVACYFGSNFENYGFNITKYSYTGFLILPFVSLILWVFSIEFLANWQTEDAEFDVVMRENAANVWFSGHFVNLNEKYKRNFYENPVTIRYVKPNYRGAFGLVCVPKEGIITEVFQ